MSDVTTTEMGVIEHVDLGLSRVISYYKDKQNYLDLLELILTEIQKVEVALHGLGNIKDLESVTGIWLDYLGDLLGEPRDGKEDEVYRVYLYLRVAINTNDGTTPSVRSVIEIYTDSDYIRTSVGILSYGQIIFNGTSNDAGGLAILMNSILPVTTTCTIMQATVLDNECPLIPKCSMLPAWEEQVATSEAFYVDDGVETSQLEVITSTEAGASSLYVSQSGENTFYDPDTEGNNLLEWEESEGVLMGTTLLPWEITEDCYFLANGTESLTELQNYYGDALEDILLGLKSIYRALPDA